MHHAHNSLVSLTGCYLRAKIQTHAANNQSESLNDNLKATLSVRFSALRFSISLEVGKNGRAHRDLIIETTVEPI